MPDEKVRPLFASKWLDVGHVNIDQHGKFLNGDSARVWVGESHAGFHSKLEVRDGNPGSWGIPLQSRNEAMDEARDKLGDWEDARVEAMHDREYTKIDPKDQRALNEWHADRYEERVEESTLGLRKDRLNDAFERVTPEQREKAQHPPPLMNKAENVGPSEKMMKPGLFLRAGSHTKKAAKPQKQRRGPHR